MKITRFEDLQCWQEARTLVNMVYAAIRNSTSFQRDFRLSNQITGAAISSMSNIAEGLSRRSNKKFISHEIFEKIYNQAEKVSKLDSVFITYLLQNEKRYGNTIKLKKLN